MTDLEHTDEFEGDEAKSKSQVKREMLALQEMGRRLTELKPDQLARVPMSDTLNRAIVETQRISSNEGLRRHMQYIGKLMRKEDAEAIQLILDEFDSSSQVHAKLFHDLERWRDRLIHEGAQALTDYLAVHPDVDHQHLRQLVRNAAKDASEEKNRGHSKKLFRYLREIQESSGSDNP